MTVRDALSTAASMVPSVPLRDAELLLASLIEKNRTWLRAHPAEDIRATDVDVFIANVKRRAAGEPLQYILGVQEFFGLPLCVTPAVLIPRPETEHLVEAVVAWAGTQLQPSRLIDVGTGSGAIALALATRMPEADIAASDISEEALAVARSNGERLGLQRVRFLKADLIGDAGSSSYDAVVSNPPYVPSGDAATMQPEVVGYEPHDALFAGVDGFDIYRRLIPAARQTLRRGGLLAMEIGFGQRDEMERLLQGWQEVSFLDDYAAIPRVVLAIRA